MEIRTRRITRGRHRPRREADGKSSNTDACVVNGSAYGEGFGFLTRGSEELQHLTDKAELCAFLAGWTLQKRSTVSKHPPKVIDSRLPSQADQRDVNRRDDRQAVAAQDAVLRLSPSARETGK